MLDKLLDDENYRNEKYIKSIERARELSLNDSKMIEILKNKLKA